MEWFCYLWKNEFDIEKYLKHELVMPMEQEFDYYEYDVSDEDMNEEWDTFSMDVSYFYADFSEKRWDMGIVHNRGPPAKPIKGKPQFLSQNNKKIIGRKEKNLNPEIRRW